MRKFQDRQQSHLTRLLEDNNFQELNEYLKRDVSGVVLEMFTYANSYTPSREDCIRRVAYALLVLQGMAGTSSYRYGNGMNNKKKVEGKLWKFYLVKRL